VNGLWLRSTLVGLVLLCAAGSPASENVWTGAAGDNLWTNAANWSLGALPDFFQDVVIENTGSNAVVVNAPVEAGSLSLGGAQGSAALNITGGTLQCEGAAQIQTNASLNLAGDLSVWMLQLDGTATWTSGSLTAWGSTTIGPSGRMVIGGLSNNLSGAFCNYGTVNCYATNLFSWWALQFTNHGLLVLHTNLALTASSGSYPYPNFYNLGTILVPANAGVVSLSPSYMFLNQGAFQAETNSVLEVRPGWSGGVQFQDGTVFDGAGVVRFTGGGNFACSGTMQVNGTVELADSSGYGLWAVWTGPGLFRWLGGALDSFTFGPGFQVEMSGLADKNVSGNCTNLGTIHWLDPASLVIASSSSFNNYGQFILQTNCALARQNGSWFGQSTFDNFGTLLVPTGVGTVPLVVGCEFYNQGILRVESNSVLEMRPSGFAGMGFQDGTVFDGAGLVRLAGGGNFACSGTMMVNGTVELADSSGYGLMAVWTGPGLFRWLGGEINSFTFGAGFQVELSGMTDKTVSGNCTNLGTIHWLDAASLVISSGSASTFNNYGQFILQTNCTLARQSGGFAQSTFNNFGTLIAPAGVGTLPLVVGCEFYNQGTFRTDSNSVLELRPSGFAGMGFQDGTIFDGAGLVRFAGGGSFSCSGTIQVNGTVELTDSTGYGLLALWTGPGLFRWLGGEIDSFTFGPGFQVEASGMADKNVSGNCTNLGTIHWLDAASLVISSGSASTFNNYGQFILRTNCTLARQSGGFAQSTFNNFGTLIAPAGAGTLPLVVGCEFYNRGSLRAGASSVLELRPSGFAGMGFQDGTIFDGAGLVRFAGRGSFSCSGTIQVNGTVELTDSTGYGLLAVWTGPGLFRWLGGEINSFTFGPGFQVEASGMADKNVSGNCTNLGTIQWMDTASLVISSGSASSFNNYGQFILQTNCTLARQNGGFAQSTFSNFGTLIAPAGVGTLPLVVGCEFYNQGTLRADSNSVLEMRPSGFAGMGFQDGTVFGGAGLVRFAGGGSFSCSGTMLVNGTVELLDCSGYGLLAVWTGPGLFRWLGGGIDSFTFGPDFHIEISGSDTKSVSGSCTNLGSVRWLGGSSLGVSWGSPTFVNGGQFTMEADCNWDPLISFANLLGGTVRQLAGQSSFGNFSNSGVTDFSSGALSASGFNSAPGAACRWTLSGPSPGAGYSPLYAGYLGLDGALEVALTNGFMPASGSSFVLATNIYRNGSFATVSLPMLSSNLSWRVRYETNAVTLKVIPPPLLSGNARLADGLFQLTLTGGEGSSYELQTSTNLVDWVTLETNGPFTGTLTLSDTNAAHYSHRFYRARIAD
jgi:hypothetical protein